MKEKLTITFTGVEIVALAMMMQDSSNVHHLQEPTRKVLNELAERMLIACKSQAALYTENFTSHDGF